MLKEQSASATSWLLLVATLPTDVPAPRMQVMRTFETLGAAVMRDGVFLLPDSAANRQAVERLVAYISANGGSAHALRVAPLDSERNESLRALFDRSARYHELIKTVESLKVGFGISDPGSISRVVHKQRREFETIAALDFFPSPAKDRAQAALSSAEQEVRSLLFPTQSAPGARTGEKFLGRLWATRRPLWADRLACAWLIRRFVDPEARLAWLDKRQDCPPDALGFAFDGARFSNTGTRVTFEEMLSQLGMESASALIRIGKVVHSLEERGSTQVAEAAGVQTLLEGAVRRSVNDDELLREAEKTFDLLYEAYAEPFKK